MRKLILSGLTIGCGLLVSLGVMFADDAKKKKEALKPIKAAEVKLGRPVDFERDILPILEDNCIACHNVAINESKLVLEEVPDILKGGKRGTAIVPKNPDKSLLYRVAARMMSPAMPPLPNKVDAVALTPKQLGLLRQWILEGASAGSGTSTDNVQFQPLPAGARSIYSVAVSPWGHLVASGRTNQISIYDVGSGQELARLLDPALAAIKHEDKPMYPGGAAHRDFVHSLAFSPDGTLLASGGYRVVKLWQRPQNIQKFQLPAGDTVTAVAISADGNWAAIGSADKTIKLWNLTDGKPGKVLSGHGAAVTGLQFWPSAEERLRVHKAVTDAQANVKTAVENAAAAKQALEKFDPEKRKLDVNQTKAETLKLVAAQTAAEKAIEPANGTLKSATDAKTAFDKLVAEQTKLVSSSLDKTVRVWKLSDGKEQRKIETPTPINSVIFNKDGTRVVSAHADNLIRVWDLAAKPKADKKADDKKKKAAEKKPEGVKPVLEIKGHGKPVTALALILPNGTQFVSGSEDATVRIWDINKGNQIRSINHGGPVTGVAARPDGGAIASASANNIAKLWDMNGKQLAELKGNVNLQRRVTLLTDEQNVAKQLVGSADGRLKAADKNVKDRGEAAKKAKTAKDNADKKVTEVKKVFDAATKKSADTAKALTAAQEAVKKAQTTLATANKKVTTDAEALKKATAAKQAADKALTQAKANTKKAQGEKTKADKAADDAAKAAKAAAEKLAAAKKAADGDKDNKKLQDALKVAEKAAADATAAKKKADEAKAAAEKNLTAAQAAEKKATETQTAAEKTRKAADDAKKAADAVKKKSEADLKTAQGKIKPATDAKAAADKETAKQKGESKKTTDAQTASNRALGLADKASKTAQEKQKQAKAKKGQADNQQKKADADLAAAQKADTAAQKPVRSIAFSPDGARLATTGDDNLLHIWDARSGKPTDTLAGHKGPIGAIAFSLNNVVVSGSADKTAVAWDPNPTWKLIGRLGAKKDDPMNLGTSPFVSRVLALDFSRDGKWLVTGGGDPSRSGELIIWDLQKQTVAREFKDAHSDTIFGVQFSWDGKYMLSGAADKFVKIFEVATGKHVKSFEGHTHHVLDVSWKADGNTVASAGADNVIKVWNVETGEQRRSIGGFGKQVTSLRFIGVGENMLSCSGDRSVRFHKSGNGQNYRSFSGGTDFMYAAATTRNESLVAAGGEDGVLRIWNGADGKVIRTYEPPK